jgi:aminoglycoside phosphotransferase (APT) family kinase protein
MLRSLRKEHSALIDVDQRVGDALLGSLPRPILLLEPEGMLVVSGVPGIVLERELQQEANVLLGWRRVAKMGRTGFAIGSWLKSFHQATAAGKQEHHHSDYLRELDSNLYRARQLGILSDVLQRVRDQAEAASYPLIGTLVQTAAGHGDFIPQNILVSEGRVGVIDFGSYWTETPVYRDLAAFLAYVALLAGKAQYSRSALEALASRFLRGYTTRLNPQLLRAFVLNAILRITNDASCGTTRARDTRRIENLLLGVATGKCWLAKDIEVCFL